MKLEFSMYSLSRKLGNLSFFSLPIKHKNISLKKLKFENYNSRANAEDENI